MRLIDFHVHCFPDEIAPKAVRALSDGYDLTPCFDGTVNGLLACMDEAGIEKAILVPVATKPSQVQQINDWAAGVMSERVIAFGAMHPDFPDPESEMRRMAEAGIKGFKLHPNWQSFSPDERRMDRIYESALGLMIIVFHMGKELSDKYKIFALPESLARVLEKHPGLTVVAAHMGGYLLWDEVEKHLMDRDIYFDISACPPEQLSDERIVSMIRAHGVERVLFGTDSPCCDSMKQVHRFLSLPLTDGEQELIAWGNASRLLGL